MSTMKQPLSSDLVAFPPKYPVEGMKVLPAYTDGDPLMTGAFIACAMATLDQPEALEAFQRDTGHRLERLVGRSPIVAMVDQATGFQSEMVASYFDWVAANVWGVEGADEDGEEDLETP